MSPQTFLEIKALFATTELPALGPGPRACVQPVERLNAAIDHLFAGSTLSSRSMELVCALVLLWHDHLEEAHRIAQGIEDRDGSLVHAIMHRREPDYGNAKYWLHRVDAHPCFPELAGRALVLFRAERETGLQERIVPGGVWDPFAFVDLSAEAARERMTGRQVQLLREIQRIETDVLLEYVLAKGSR